MRTLVALLLSASLVAAGAQSSGAPAAPTPPPEVARLNAFVGSWRGAGEVIASPLGPAGKSSSTERCAWFEGKFHIACDSEIEIPGVARLRGHMVLGYDAKSRAYTGFMHNSAGDSGAIRGSYASGTWRFESEGTANGRRFFFRYTIEERSPTLQAYRMEVSTDGKNYQLVEKGTNTAQHAP